MNNGLAQRLNLGHEEEVDSPRGKRFCKVIVFFLISRYACAELVDKGRRLGRRNTHSLSTRQLYARSRPPRSKFFCPTSFMGGSINSEIHGIQFWCAICMVLKASFLIKKHSQYHTNPIIRIYRTTLISYPQEEKIGIKLPKKPFPIAYRL